MPRPQGSLCSRSQGLSPTLTSPLSPLRPHPHPHPLPLPSHRCEGALNTEEPEAAWLAYKGCSLLCLPHSSLCSALHSPLRRVPCDPPPHSSPSLSMSCLAFFLCTFRSLSVSSPSPPLTPCLQTSSLYLFHKTFHLLLCASPLLLPLLPCLSLFPEKKHLLLTHTPLALAKDSTKVQAKLLGILITHNEREIMNKNAFKCSLFR